MGLHDTAKRLVENQGEVMEAKDERVVEQATPAQDLIVIESVSSAETDRLEKLLFKFSAIIEKIEAERREMKKLSLEVDKQKDTVGKMLVSLDNVIESLPSTVNASIKSSLDCNATSIDHATSRVTGEMDRQVSSIMVQVVKVLNDGLASSVAGIRASASQAATAAASMEMAKNYVGWRIIAVNIGVSFLVVFILLGAVNRRFPWQLHGPSSQERTYIELGKALTKSWSQLPAKNQDGITTLINVCSAGNHLTLGRL